MKKESRLVRILYWFCNISFYLLIIWIVTAIGFEIFTEDGKVGNFSSGSHRSIGYQIPVKVQINPRSPLYKNKLFELENEGVNHLGQSYSSGTSTYVKALTAQDSLDFKSIVSIRNYDMTDYYDLASTSFISEGYVTVKPKTLRNKVTIVFRTYLGFFILIIVFFFLKNIFKALKANFEFSQKLYKAIRAIGFLLIALVLLKVVSNFILGKDLPFIVIEPLGDNMKYVAISMNPRLDFDFTLFLVGFMLIVLSTLLKRGRQIQEENDLTI